MSDFAQWAAINNQYVVCKYLLEQGADVNAQGGESYATAAMWAAQRCHFYIVNLMIQHGADLLLADGQGYNILHLATIDGNALLVILLLHQDIPVDTPDPQGHTSLMWAAYKGWPACVDLLLRWGANVNAKDDNGYTPLHWGLVKGSKPCLEKLIEYDADRFAKTNEGKTPAICSEEMNSKGPYRRALQTHGYTPDGNRKVLPFGLSSLVRDKSKMSKLFFFAPTVMLFISLYLVSQAPIYLGLPLSIVSFMGIQLGFQKLAAQGLPDSQHIHKTPFLAGVFAGTLFWVGMDWVSRVLPTTFSTHPLYNTLFGIFYCSTAYFYYLSMVEDPGFIPKPKSRNQTRGVIQELFSLWKYDEENFCVQCMVRKPLRSKHCRRCGRCVAKIDHHCPWVHNCVANNNLRHFYIYILSLLIGIILFVYLALEYLSLLPAPSKTATCNVLGGIVCSLALRDPWTVALTIWTFFQCVWVTMLLVVQTIQIAKNTTTFENMKRHDRHGHHTSHLPLHSARPTTIGASTGLQSLNDTAAAATRIHPHPRRPDGFLTRWKKMLGLDTFIATASDAAQGRLQSRGNPFSRGLVGNCKDFWCDPAPIFGKRHNGDSLLGGEVVNYTDMYETPLRARSGRTGVDSMVYSAVADDENDD